MTKKQFLNLNKGDVVRNNNTGETLTVDGFQIEGSYNKKYTVVLVKPLKVIYLQDQDVYKYSKIT